VAAGSGAFDHGIERQHAKQAGDLLDAVDLVRGGDANGVGQFDQMGKRDAGFAVSLVAGRPCFFVAMALPTRNALACGSYVGSASLSVRIAPSDDAGMSGDSGVLCNCEKI
jgi:hypothetical protein